jgi:hypothetical protein
MISLGMKCVLFSSYFHLAADGAALRKLEVCPQDRNASPDATLLLQFEKWGSI